jgi:hypothetical protein
MLPWGAAAQEEPEPVVVETRNPKPGRLMFLMTRFVPSVAALVSRVQCQRRIGASQWVMVRAGRSSSGTSLEVQWSSKVTRRRRASRTSAGR